MPKSTPSSTPGSSSGFDLIPPSRQEAVRQALRAAFGRGAAKGFAPISGGVSGALILRFQRGERSYVLRLEPQRIALADRQRGFACMAAAAEAGVAPRIFYTDPAAGVAIMDFIASRPLSDHPQGRAGIVRELGGLIARVQATEPFPDLGDYPGMISAMLAALDGSGLFAPGRLTPHREGLARISAAYPWDSEARVSSHNDPNPRNILFDGRRLWLVDWELAFRNDPLGDIAILTTELAETPALEDLLLETVFGSPPDAALRARLSLMRLLTRLFYGCVVLDVFAKAPEPWADRSLEAFTPLEFRAAVADGRLKSGAPDTAYAFGKMSLAAFVEGVAAPGFEDTLRRVG